MNPTVDELRKILADLPGDAEVRIQDGAVIIGFNGQWDWQRRRDEADWRGMMEEDITNALMDLRHAFAKHDLPVPDGLTYSDPGEACKALATLRKGISRQHWVSTYSANPTIGLRLCGLTIKAANPAPE